MPTYIHQLPRWPHFEWDTGAVLTKLAQVRHRQGKLATLVDLQGKQARTETTLHTLTLEVMKSTEIEGEILSADSVRSSIARRLGIDHAGVLPPDRAVEGIVEVMLDATQHYAQALDAERLFAWHAALFPTGRSGSQRIPTAMWRTGERGPMQVVSGPAGREKVHFEAPGASQVPHEMEAFLTWVNDPAPQDPVLKAAIAHVWFVTIHPFADGNGRIARAITDLLLARSDQDAQPFYSVSAQMRLERNQYYAVLEQTQKGNLDITQWLLWFLECMDNALAATEALQHMVVNKANFWAQHAHIPVNERQAKLLNRLLDGFVGKLTTAKWASIAHCSSDTALRDIQDLIQKGMLQKEPGGGRSTAYGLVE